LISDSPIPAHQISAGDFTGPLASQTNAAIKGLIGIAAMGEIENILGNTRKASNYKVTEHLLREGRVGLLTVPQSIAANYVTLVLPRA